MSERIRPHRYKTPPSYEFPSLHEVRCSYATRTLHNVPAAKRSRCVCRVRNVVTLQLQRPLMDRFALIDGGRWVAIYDYCFHCERRKLHPLTQTNEIFMWTAKVKSRKRRFIDATGTEI